MEVHMQLLVEGTGKLGQTVPHNIKEKNGSKLQEIFKLAALLFTENEDFTPTHVELMNKDTGVC